MSLLSLRSNLRLLIGELVALVTILSATNLLPTKHWIQEINVSGGGYYFVLHLLSLPLIYFGKSIFTHRTRRNLLLAVPLLCLFYLKDIAPFYLGPVAYDHRADKGPIDNSPLLTPGRGFSVLMSNVERSNRNYAVIAQRINEANADLITLLEVSHELLDHLSLKKRYPFSIEIPQDNMHGIALFSKFPLSGRQFIDVGQGLPPVIVSEVVFPEKTITFATFHTYPPGANIALDINQRLMRRVSTEVRNREWDLVMAGDLNATPFSWYYKKFIAWNDVQNAMYGFGFNRTWNAHNWFLRFTIDHVVYRGRIEVEDYQRLQPIGSDHFPILVKFKLR